MIQLGEHFGDDSRSAHLKEWQRKRWFIKARTDKVHHQEMLNEAKDSMLATAVVTVVATDIQIREFRARLDVYDARLDAYEAKLDSYDEAIVRALTENQEKLSEIDKQLADVEVRLQDMLDRAYVMEDRRRVFKSEDGKTVTDEHGENVTSDEVDFGLVVGPSSNSYFEHVAFEHNRIEARTAIEKDNEELLKAQDKIDAAKENVADSRQKIQDVRNGLEKEGLTADEIEKYEADILDAMPPLTLPTLPISALKQLSGVRNSVNTPAAKDTFAINAEPATTAQPTSSPNQQFGFNN